MRALQFWILLFGSILTSGFLIKEIFLSRSLSLEERTFSESQQTVSSGTTYENAWKQLAIHIYQASRQDPDFAAVLKNENVVIHAGPASTPPASPSAAPVSSKAPVPPPHPSTP